MPIFVCMRRALVALRALEAKIIFPDSDKYQHMVITPIGDSVLYSNMSAFWHSYLR
ncbi:MAG: hypothetical protein OYH77_08710 [Pseudomonadota bacterium]|nr:hypothetical protein [Pseudomonadota bacterium]